MEITKEFSCESSHIVRNCTSKRCSHSIHGHSYRILLTLSATQLDHAGMVVDFGLLKGSIKEFIDSMDHCHVICGYDDLSYVEFCKRTCDRWIELPFNPSAEMLAVFFHRYCQDIINRTIFKNGEDSMSLYVKSVQVYETQTGSAKTNQQDIVRLWNPAWNDMIQFSDGVMEDWSDDLKDIVFNNKEIINREIKQQILIPGFNDEMFGE